MPGPTLQGELDVVVDRGFPSEAVTLEGLFRYRNEPLDPIQDARTDPGVFSPLCGFTGSLVLRGAGCQVAFGWYNAVPGRTTPPGDEEIYELVPADITVAAQCEEAVFCPLAAPATSSGGQQGWVPVTFSADEIRRDPRYQGGLIGFALKGAEGTDCPQTKFSQAELNVRSPAGPPTNGAPWITTLIYQSVATPDAFYVAFEDLPMERETWKGEGDYENDGDFNDFVYFITGLTCAGGGEPCDASASHPELKGVCAVGRTGCAVSGAEPACNPVVKPGVERCDNLDNDCDGLVDDGDLCPAGEVCDQGTCVRSCSGGEFHCDSGLVCSASGFCVDPACKDVECASGQVCRKGVCSGGCDEQVKCPLGQECQLGRCVDPCQGVTCEGNQVCEKGVCLPDCSCRSCGAGKTCAAAGPDANRCVDTGCEALSCDAGARCVNGACVDLCEGVVCPGNATCTNGQCADPLPEPDEPPSDPSSGGALVLVPPEVAGSQALPPLQPTGGTGGIGGSPGIGGAPATGRGDTGSPSCGCRTPGSSRTSGGLGVIAAGIVLCLVRTRRSRGSRS